MSNWEPGIEGAPDTSLPRTEDKPRSGQKCSAHFEHIFENHLSSTSISTSTVTPRRGEAELVP